MILTLKMLHDNYDRFKPEEQTAPIVIPLIDGKGNVHGFKTLSKENVSSCTMQLFDLGRVGAKERVMIFGPKDFDIEQHVENNSMSKVGGLPSEDEAKALAGDKEIAIIIEREKDNFSAFALNVEGIYGAGSTIEEAKQSIEIGIDLIKTLNKPERIPALLRTDYTLRYYIEEQKAL